MLEPDEPPAFEVVNPHGSSTGTAFLICDHASPRLPRRLGDLGLSEAQRLDHIGWDPGAALVARRLAALLDAPLVLSGYSRLAIDCNRPPHVPASVPAQSCGVPIPGNADVDDAERAARAEALFHPYHRAIAALLDWRRQAGQRTALLSVHSFTPVLGGQTRPWQIGVMYGRDRRLADLLLRALRRDAALVVGDNQPYTVTDTTDYGVPVHGEARGLPCVLIELRNDLISEEDGACAWAQRLHDAYREIEPALLDLCASAPD
jgi:predicted N-formylglutamate amidohydrolase